MNVCMLVGMCDFVCMCVCLPASVHTCACVCVGVCVCVCVFDLRLEIGIFPDVARLLLVSDE